MRIVLKIFCQAKTHLLEANWTISQNLSVESQNTRKKSRNTAKAVKITQRHNEIEEIDHVEVPDTYLFLE